MALAEKPAFGLIDTVLALAKKAAPDADVRVGIQSGGRANTRFAVNRITSCGDVAKTEVRLEVAVGKRHASTESNQTDSASLSAAVERTVAMAKLAPEDPEYLPTLDPQKYLPVPSRFDPRTARLTAAVRARAIAGAIRAAQKKKVQIAGFLQHHEGALALGTSNGVRAYYQSTMAELSTTARTPDGTGSGWAAGFSHRFGDVDVDTLAQVAIDKGVASQNPGALAPGKYTVVLEPAAVADLLTFLLFSLDARRADEGRSFFSKPGGGNRLGEQIFGEHVTLVSDPADPLAPAAPFDGDGLPRARITWIDRGRVGALSRSRFWAHKTGQTPTPQPGSFHLHGGQAKSTDELVQGVERGVLITRFWYLRPVDPRTILATGLTRDGVFLIEKGKVTRPVNNFRFNESPVVMLKNAEAMTAETFEYRAGGRLRVPAIRTTGFNLASVSEAV